MQEIPLMRKATVVDKFTDHLFVSKKEYFPVKVRGSAEERILRHSLLFGMESLTQRRHLEFSHSLTV